MAFVSRFHLSIVVLAVSLHAHDVAKGKYKVCYLSNTKPCPLKKANYVSNKLCFLFCAEQTFFIENFHHQSCIDKGGEYVTDLDTCKRAAVFLQEQYPTAFIVDETHLDFLSQTQPKGCFAWYQGWTHYILFNKHQDGCTCPNARRICVQDKNEK